ncbi:hypothetical protein [Exiguobacterium sp. 8H]|uniref:hypothetical protein n=1 Tax=Exiguobacterium sp. 8H TaxID=2653140 RepID=UPI00135A1345|nr:hypothetical protein [Exiguobacterium sp. 8H]
MERLWSLYILSEYQGTPNRDSERTSSYIVRTPDRPHHQPYGQERTTREKTRRPFVCQSRKR